MADFGRIIRKKRTVKIKFVSDEKIPDMVEERPLPYMVTAEEILRRRVAALLEHSEQTRKDLAIYLGKSPSWATDFFQGRHGVTLKDLDRLARFFGLAVPQLFELDGYRFRDRRRGQRRNGKERRSAEDRRKNCE